MVDDWCGNGDEEEKEGGEEEEEDSYVVDWVAFHDCLRGCSCYLGRCLEV